MTTPTGWKFENSLSCTYCFVPTGYLDKVARFLRKEAGGEIYWDELAGAEMFVGRAFVN